MENIYVNKENKSQYINAGFNYKLLAENMNTGKCSVNVSATKGH